MRLFEKWGIFLRMGHFFNIYNFYFFFILNVFFMIPRLVPEILPCDGFCDGAGGAGGLGILVG